jgi:predicted nucleic acid-binding protein
VNVYLDASVLVALFVHEPFSGRVDSFLRTRSPTLIVSDFAAAELASAVARRVRMGEIDTRSAQEAFAKFDGWSVRDAERVQITTADIAEAAAFIRRLDLILRAPDAINIAITRRVGAELFTFDRNMAAAAQALGTNVVSA